MVKTALMIFVLGLIVYYLAGKTGSALSFVGSVLQPLVLGLVFTYLLSPAVGKLEKKLFGSLKKPASRRAAAVLLTFVIAGGVSNMIDRLTLGYVTDMISCGNFAVFNVADIAVTCGCALTILYLLLEMRKEGKRDSTER